MSSHRRLEALGVRAASAAHELGTPLSTIAVVAKELELGLQRRGGSPEDVADVQLIRAEVERCRRILDRMTTHSGAGGEGFSSARAADLAAWVVGEMAAKARVIVEATEIPGGEPMQLPKEGLAGALRALVQNAVDATLGDVAVRLSVEHGPQGLGILVSDEGCGMSPETLERALEPFFSSKGPGAGMGLGLYLAQHFIESLGGALAIESSLGRGTMVRVKLPLPLPLASASSTR